MNLVTEKLVDRVHMDKSELIRLYKEMVLIRKFELTAGERLRKGDIPGFIHLYVGQEAVATGVCAHLKKTDWVTSTHRGHGHAIAKGVDPKKVMAELYGKETGCSGGRGGTMHIYSPEDGLFGTNGIVGAGNPLAIGLALSQKIQKKNGVVVSFFGDGAVNHGTFHESVNFAGIQNLPVVFVCENNKYATCIALTDATKNANVASKAAAYGIPGIQVDGNDVKEVWQVAAEAIERARNGNGPTLIEALTYRTVGHYEGDVLVGTYRTQEEIDQWKLKCPILKHRNFILNSHIATATELDEIEAAVAKQVDEIIEYAQQSPWPAESTLYRHSWAEPVNPSEADHIKDDSKVETKLQGWMEAVRDAIAEEMRKDPYIMYLGEGIGKREGTFGHTKNLWKEFGKERVIDTPICELGFTGAAIGASASGSRTISDVMMGDFIFEAASQVIHQAGKLRYMSNGKISVPSIIRAGIAAIKQTAAHHSGTYHSVWAHCPGLLVVIPSNPADAKGLMKTALRAKDPVLFLEPKAFFSMKGHVPTGEHFVPFGIANTIRYGQDLTIVSCGLPLPKCVEAANLLEKNGISCEIIDLRTIVPLDAETIIKSVTKTGRLLIVDEGFAMCGIGAEINALIMENAFDKLKAPVGRLHTEPITHPFSPVLENATLISTEKIILSAKRVIEGAPIPPLRLTSKGLIRKLQITETSGKKIEQDDKSSLYPNSENTDNLKQGKLLSGINIIMPNQDLTITEARVVRWLAQVGESVKKGKPIVEVETDKAIVELEAPADGTLIQIVAQPETVVTLGATLGTISPL